MLPEMHQRRICRWIHPSVITNGYSINNSQRTSLHDRPIDLPMDTSIGNYWRISRSENLPYVIHRSVSKTPARFPPCFTDGFSSDGLPMDTPSNISANSCDGLSIGKPLQLPKECSPSVISIGNVDGCYPTVIPSVFDIFLVVQIIHQTKK